MSVPVELLVHHGGLMSFSGRSPRYVNGEVVECSFDPDFLCYFQLRKLGTEDLKYDSVEKIWFVPPGKTLANGLSEVNNDADAAKIVEAGKTGVVETERTPEEIPMDNDGIVDMTNMASHRGNIHSASDADDEESEEDSDFEPPSDVPSEEVSLDEVNTEQVNTEQVFPRAVPNSPLSSYRNSSQSEHDVDAKYDEEECTSVFAGQPWGCNKRGHNSRKCPDKNKTAPSADQQNVNVEQPRASQRRTRRAEAEGPSVPAPRRRKVVTCGTCGSSGHNARSCYRNRGVEAVIDPRTNRMQRNNEMRTAMHGVGVYTNPSTGNMYYKGPPTGLNASRSPVVDDYIGGSQPDPPPATQPTQ
ncbi:hypothetical protein LINPERHAP2_LOCUS22191 [Linum perenne]